MNGVRVTIFGAIVALVLIFLVFEMIRRRRLQERYAILWLLTGVVLLVLSLWEGAIGLLASIVGIQYPPALLFAVALIFFVIVLLHYSTVLSRLAKQNLALAQSIALLEQRLRNVERDADSGRDESV